MDGFERVCKGREGERDEWTREGTQVEFRMWRGKGEELQRARWTNKKAKDGGKGNKNLKGTGKDNQVGSGC